MCVFVYYLNFFKFFLRTLWNIKIHNVLIILLIPINFHRNYFICGLTHSYQKSRFNFLMSQNVLKKDIIRLFLTIFQWYTDLNIGYFSLNKETKPPLDSSLVKLDIFFSRRILSSTFSSRNSTFASSLTGNRRWWSALIRVSGNVGTGAFKTDDKRTERPHVADPVSMAIGEFGRWQAVLTLVLSLLNLPCTWHIFVLTFQGADTDFWCAPPPGLQLGDRVSVDQWKNLSGVFIAAASGSVNQVRTTSNTGG